MHKKVPCHTPHSTKPGTSNIINLSSLFENQFLSTKIKQTVYKISGLVKKQPSFYVFFWIGPGVLKLSAPEYFYCRVNKLKGLFCLSSTPRLLRTLQIQVLHAALTNKKLLHICFFKNHLTPAP